MKISKVWIPLAALAVVVALAVAGVLTRETWQGWLFRGQFGEEAKKEEGHSHGDENRVRLSPQARENLNLSVRQLELTKSYPRTIQVPGTVEERPGQSDRNLTTPIAGVVVAISARPGDLVRPGEPDAQGRLVRPGTEVFALRLTSESLNTQAELFKNQRELEIVKEQLKPLQDPKVSGSINPLRIAELENQIKRLNNTLYVLEQDLEVRGLSKEQVRAVRDKAEFVKEMTIRVPPRPAPPTAVPSQAGPGLPFVYEVEDIQVRVGEQVEAGQTLAHLGNHQVLDLVGRAFAQEAPLLKRAAEKGWAVQVEFPEGTDADWQPLPKTLAIRSLASTIDADSQTFAFYLTLPNEAREYQREGKTYRTWRFRPGQRARLHVRVQEFENVFVLPAAAVVRDGPETYAFRQNGESFERKPVRVLYEDRRNVVIENDGSITAGSYVTHNGAAQLNRALKTKAAEGEGHGHAGHSHPH